MNTNEILCGLSQPLGKDWRPLPFWFWNGTITEAGIREQLQEMKAHGIGGVLISPRQGMDVPYLSEAYFDLYRYAVQVAQELDLSVWIYDEYPYPSGISGGEVLMRHPELRQTCLERKALITDGGKVVWSLGWGVVLDVKAVPLQHGKADWQRAMDLSANVGVRPAKQVFQEDSGLTTYNPKRFFTHDPEMCLQVELPAGEWRLEACVQSEIHDFKYYNGFIDPCDPGISKAFLETTHERYYRAMGEWFGTVIKGVFTDETGLLGGVPWSKQAPEAYAEAYGEDICPHLCEMLSEDAPMAPFYRERLYRVIHHLLQENYHHPVADWCREHDLLYIAEVPGMRMTTQKYSDVVGGDFNHEKIGVPLDEIHDLHTANYRHNPTAISSLARQLGHGRALIESYHSIGWSMTLQDAKWGMDYIVACGINRYVFHAFFYLTEGLRKYDAPPSQFYQNPYWKYYHLFSDYVAGNSWITNHTEGEIQTALLEPTTGLWQKLTNPFEDYTYAGVSETEKAAHEDIRSRWFRTRRALFHAQIGFDHLDPEMLIRADFHDGLASIGKANYRVLILTDRNALEEDTRHALLRFVECGGILLCVDQPASDRAASDSGLPFAGVFSPDDESGLCDAVLRRIHVPMRFCPDGDDSGACLSHLRLSERKEPWLFVANQEADAVSGVLELDPLWKTVCKIGADGKKTYMRADRNGLVSIQLGAYESAWYVALETVVPEEADRQTVGLQLDGKRPCRLLGKNCLRLSECDWTMDGVHWSRSEIKPYFHLIEQSGILDRGTWNTTDAFGLPKQIGLHFPQVLRLKLGFAAGFIPDDLTLVFEKQGISGERTISLNGLVLKDWKETTVHGNTFCSCAVSSCTKVGINILEIQVTVHHEWEGLVDAVLLEGSFSVAQHPENGLPCIHPIEAEALFHPEAPSWAPYFSGEIEWDVSFSSRSSKSPVFLIPRSEMRLANCMTLHLNGVDLGTCAFSPYGWEVPAGLLRDGQNEAKMIVSNTLVHRYEGRCFDYRQHILEKPKGDIL